MKGTNYHSLFYYLVISLLQNLRGGDGRKLSENYKGEDAPSFAIGYEPRHPNGYEFTYMRDQFISHRNKYVIATRDQGNYVVLVRESADGNEATLFTDALAHLFPEDTEEAQRELHDLLDKFYTLTVEERSGLQQVDLSTNRSQNHMRVDRVFDQGQQRVARVLGLEGYPF